MKGRRKTQEKETCIPSNGLSHQLAIGEGGAVHRHERVGQSYDGQEMVGSQRARYSPVTSRRKVVHPLADRPCGQHQHHVSW